jgi:hypothetical protein
MPTRKGGPRAAFALMLRDIQSPPGAGAVHPPAPDGMLPLQSFTKFQC